MPYIQAGTSRLLGKPDFDGYCRATGQGRAQLIRKDASQQTGYSGAYYINGRNAYGWYCENSISGINVNDACRRLYGVPIARFQNFYDKNSWQCWG